MTAYKGREKRKYLRMDSSYVINYRIQELLDSYDLSQTKNISQGGVLITTNKQFEKGARLTMNLRIPFVLQKIELNGEVINSREIIRDLSYETRIKFLDLNDDFFKKLGEFIKENLK